MCVKVLWISWLTSMLLGETQRWELRLHNKENCMGWARGEIWCGMDCLTLPWSKGSWHSCCGFGREWRNSGPLCVWCSKTQCRCKYIVLFLLLIWTPDGVTCKPKWSQCNQKHCHKHILQVKCANGNMLAENERCNQSGFEVAVREYWCKGYSNLLVTVHDGDHAQTCGVL